MRQSRSHAGHLLAKKRTLATARRHPISGINWRQVSPSSATISQLAWSQTSELKHYENWRGCRSAEGRVGPDWSPVPQPWRGLGPVGRTQASPNTLTISYLDSHYPHRLRTPDTKIIFDCCDNTNDADYLRSLNKIRRTSSVAPSKYLIVVATYPSHRRVWDVLLGRTASDRIKHHRWRGETIYIFPDRAPMDQLWSDRIQREEGIQGCWSWAINYPTHGKYVRK